MAPLFLRRNSSILGLGDRESHLNIFFFEKLITFDIFGSFHIGRDIVHSCEWALYSVMSAILLSPYLLSTNLATNSTLQQQSTFLEN